MKFYGLGFVFRGGMVHCCTLGEFAAALHHGV